MKKLTLCLLAVVSLLCSSIFAQQTKSFKKILAEAESIKQKKARTEAQSKTMASFAPGLVISSLWNKTSTTWQFLDSTSFAYNNYGLLSEETYSSYPSIGRIKYTYNAKQRVTEEIQQTWNPINNQWKDKEKTTFIFDQHDNQIEQSTYTFNSSTNFWLRTSGYKNILTYDSNNRIIDDIEQGWNSSSQLWEDLNRTTNYIYDSKGNALQYEEQIKNGTFWNNDTRMINSYSISNALVDEILEIWNGTAYVKSERYTNIGWHNWTNDPKTSALASYTLQEYGTPVLNQWNTVSRYNAIYDAYGGFVGIYQDYINSTWLNTNRLSILYDTHSNYSGFRSENWNTVTSVWQHSTEERQNHTYDASNNLSQTIWQIWDSNNLSLVNYFIKEYSDYKLISGILSQSNFTDIGITVYPNPVNSYFTLRLADETLLNKNEIIIFVYDLLGKVVFETKVTGEETQIQRGNLAQGIYYYAVMDQAGSLAKGKLIIN